MVELEVEIVEKWQRRRDNGRGMAVITEESTHTKSPSQR